MAVKRISAIEANVEKIVLGLAGAGLVGVLVYQFVGPHPLVAVGAGNAKKSVPVTEAWPVVENEAKRLRGLLEAVSAPVIPAPTTGDLAADFRKQIPLIPSAQHRPFVVASGDARSANPANPSAGLSDIYAMPAIPALTLPVAASFESTVDKREIDASPDVAKLMPSTMPFDKAGVTVETTFNGELLRIALEADPDGSGPIKPLPGIWWDATTAAMFVEATREEMLADGTWGKSTVLAPLAGRFSLKPQIDKGVIGRPALERLTEEAQQAESEVLRPEWYARPVFNGNPIGEEWKAPSEMVPAPNGDPDAPNIPGTRRELAEVQRRIAQLNKNMDQLKRVGPGGGGGGPGGGRGPGGGGGGRPTGGDNKAQIDRLQAQIDALTKRAKELEDILTKANQKPVKAATQTNAILLADPAVQMWVHDATVEQGKSYRYKMQLWISNPFFGRAGLAKEQEPLAMQPVLKGEYSSWSNPVSVDEGTLYFVTAATDAASNKSPTSRGAYATAEMYRFWWGYWRKATLTLDPGDKLIKTQTLPDFEKILAMAPMAAAPGGPAAPPLVDPAPAGGPGRRVGGGGAPAPTAPPVPANPADPNARPTLDLKSLPMVPLEIARDAFMLDVSTVPEATKSFQVYLRESNSQIVIRRPDVDSAEKRLKKVRESAAAGESLLAKAAGTEKDPEQPKPKPRPDETIPPPGGGGGGGGGGG